VEENNKERKKFHIKDISYFVGVLFYIVWTTCTKETKIITDSQNKPSFFLPSVLLLP